MSVMASVAVSGTLAKLTGVKSAPPSLLAVIIVAARAGGIVARVVHRGDQRAGRLIDGQLRLELRAIIRREAVLVILIRRDLASAVVG